MKRRGCPKNVQCLKMGHASKEARGKRTPEEGTDLPSVTANINEARKL